MSAPTSDHAPRSLLGKVLGPKTIRGRLARILLVSLILVFALLGDIISGVVERYIDTNDTLNSLVIASRVHDVAREVALERGLTNGLLYGDGRFQDMLTAQRLKTDQAMQSLDAALAEHDVPVNGQVRAGLAKLSGLSAIRESIDAHRADRSAAFQFFVDGIEGLLRINFGDQAVANTPLRISLQAQYVLGYTKEEDAQERDLLAGVFAAGRFAGDDYSRLNYILAAKQSTLAAFEIQGGAAYKGPFEDAFKSPQSMEAAAAERFAVASGSGSLPHPVDPMTWWSQMNEQIDALGGVQKALADDVHGHAETLLHGAAVSLVVYLATAIGMAMLEVWLVIGCMRSIIRPLSALAREADDVATNRLPASVEAWHASASGTEPTPPEPVKMPPSAGMEIASVAHALDRVQHTAWELASEQMQLRRNTTESLANLGRRHQNLVRRQLGLISEFEREELDPSALANLFELDHLATRMRRNAESLLVLVGETSRRKWSEPIPLTDVIRAGLSEVEGYRRVALRRLDEIWIAGTAVSELAHMLAELIENGLSFSPPDLEVEVYGRAAGGHYLLAVVDHGVGMSRDELAQANARLRGDADFLVSSSRFLGHYVVGRLAMRLGIEVELTVSPVGGVVARLLLPSEIIVDPKSLPAASNGNGAAPQPISPPPGASSATGNIAGTSAATGNAAAPSAVGAIAVTGEFAPVAVIDVPPAEEPSAPQGESTAETAPVQTTRNGLVKRPRRPGNAPSTGEQSAIRLATSATGPVPQRSPDEVRSLLSSFRAGHQRGVDGTQVDEELR